MKGNLADLLMLIDDLKNDESVTISVTFTSKGQGAKTQERKTSAPVKEEQVVGKASEPEDVPVEKPKATRTRKANAIEPNPATETAPSDDKPKVDYATIQMGRADDMIQGGDFDKAISILQQACDADRKNKTLAEALYDAKMAKAKAALGSDEPTEIKLPKKTPAQPVAEPVEEFNQDDSNEETF